MSDMAARIRAAVRSAPKRQRVTLGIALVVLGGFVAVAVLAPLIAPYGFDQVSAGSARFEKQLAPSSAHPLGTTVQATDVLSRTIWGARTALELVVVAVGAALVIGLPLGLLSGFLGGPLDRVLVLFSDALLALPALLLAIVVAFVLSDAVGGGLLAAAVAVTAVFVPQYFRVVRNQVLSLREETYVEAARALGASRRAILGRYVLPNVTANLPTLAALNAADAILTLAALGFLGYGIQPTDAAEWGYDLQRAVDDAGAGIWWTGLFPGLAIVTLVIGLTLAAETLNEMLNPTLRGRTARPPLIKGADRG